MSSKIAEENKVINKIVYEIKVQLKSFIEAKKQSIKNPKLSLKLVSRISTFLLFLYFIFLMFYHNIPNDKIVPFSILAIVLLILSELSSMPGRIRKIKKIISGLMKFVLKNKF
jgi:hypothetical protein